MYLRRGFRLLSVIGAGAVATLAAAGPALADESPLPETPPVVEPLIPETWVEAIPLPALPPSELTEPPLVDAIVDASNVDVSVRVLSPGEEPAGAQESETPPISELAEPDITAPAVEDLVPAEATAESPEARNINVSVRVLSPGDRGDVGQHNAGGGEEVVEAGTLPSESSAEPRPASPTHGDSTGDSTQYHIPNSSGQYESDSGPDAWNWTWSLMIDCAGNAASSSADTGDPASLVWSWSWAWTWGCSEAPTPDSRTPSSSPQPPAPAQSDELAGAPVSAPVSTGASGEPWAWTWTFTFCGETTTMSTNAGAGTPLRWTWDWNWTWLCPLTIPADATPLPEVDAPPLPVQFLPEPDAVPDLPLPSVWLASAPPELQRGVTTEVIVVPSLPSTSLASQIEVVIPAVVLPVPTTTPSLPVPGLPLPSAAAAAGPTTTATGPSRRPSPPPPTIARQETLADHLPQTEPRAEHARPAKRDRARGARPHRPLPPIPLDRPQPRQATGSSSFGGFVPSALLLGVAALTGFILLAAPGLGRRIRLARELSPRGLGQSPLDRPG